VLIAKGDGSFSLDKERMKGGTNMARPLFISKKGTDIVIFTPSHRIEGKVHVHPGSRFTDFMEARTHYGFIAVTDANVYPVSGDKALYSVEFLNINKNFIAMIFPKTDIE
jgi:hypothetical protein